MSTLLRIDSGSRTTGSFSRSVVDTFEKSWRGANPDGDVIVRDLAVDVPPHLDEHAVSGRGQAREGLSPEQQDAFDRRAELLAELDAADTWVFSVPMYNWSIPSALKAWIDTVVAPDIAAAEDGTGRFAGKKAVVVFARGGGYGPGTPKASWNHQTPYLELIFRTVLGLELELIDAELTLAPVVPALSGLLDVHEASLEAAHTRAAALV